MGIGMIWKARNISANVIYRNLFGSIFICYYCFEHF